MELRGEGPQLPRALHLGKLGCRGLLNAVVPGALVHILDQLSGRRFLIDTGASFSIFPFQSNDPVSGPNIMGPAGQRIPCWGTRTLGLCFHGRRFEWPFLLAAVRFPIIGVDFARHHRLMVDPAANQLIDTASLQVLPTISSVKAEVAADVKAPPGSSADTSQVATCGQPRHHLPWFPSPPSSSPPVPADGRPRGPFTAADHPGVVNPTQTRRAVTHRVVHYLQTTGRPIAAKLRRLGGEQPSDV